MEFALVFIQLQTIDEKCENCSWKTIDGIGIIELQFA